MFLPSTNALIATILNSRIRLAAKQFARDRKTAVCATRDIAAAAAKLLPVDSWSGQSHLAVPGPEDLSFKDMAATMSAVLGKPGAANLCKHDAHDDKNLARESSCFG